MSSTLILDTFFERKPLIFNDFRFFMVKTAHKLHTYSLKTAHFFGLCTSISANCTPHLPQSLFLIFYKLPNAGRFWHCAVMMLTCVSASDTQYRLRLCSSIPLLSVRQHRALNLFQAGCCALAMAMGGEAQARERRMATEAGGWLRPTLAHKA